MKTVINGDMNDDDLDDDLEIDDENEIEIEDGAETRVDLDDESDDDAADEDGSEDVDDDDLESYSKPIRDRIRREREEAAQARSRAEAAEQELAKARAESELSAIDGDLSAAIDEVEEARRDADTRKEVLAQAKVTRLSARKEELEKQRQSGGGTVEKNEALDRWLGRNAWFKDSERYVAQRNAAIAIGRQVAAKKGLKDDTDAFYAEVDKELRKSVRLPAGEKPPRTTIGQRISDRGSQNPGARQVRLTAEDVRFMRDMKLDPSDKKVVNAYLMEKRNAR